MTAWKWLYRLSLNLKWFSFNYSLVKKSNVRGSANLLILRGVKIFFIVFKMTAQYHSFQESWEKKRDFDICQSKCIRLNKFFVFAFLIEDFQNYYRNFVRRFSMIIINWKRFYDISRTVATVLCLLYVLQIMDGKEEKW